jgi:hypothetical protein
MLKNLLFFIDCTSNENKTVVTNSYGNFPRNNIAGFQGGRFIHFFTLVKGGDGAGHKQHLRGGIILSILVLLALYRNRIVVIIRK